MNNTSGAIEDGHAAHVHSHCDCTYGVRFDVNTDYAGYDPGYYEDKYYGAQKMLGVYEDEAMSHPGKHGKRKSTQTLNAMRREQYRNMPKAEKEELLARKRESYERNKERRESGELSRNI